MTKEADLIVKSFAGQTNPGDLQLSDREKALGIKLLANPAFFPDQFLSWLEGIIPMFNLKVPISQVAGKITSAMIAPQEVWIAPTPLNSWADFGAGYAPAGYFKDTLGIVHLRGLIKNGSPSTSTMFTLPAGSRPEYLTILAIVSNDALGELRIETNGNVSISVGNAAWVSLDGITFRAA